MIVKKYWINKKYSKLKRVKAGPTKYYCLECELLGTCHRLLAVSSVDIISCKSFFDICQNAHYIKGQLSFAYVEEITKNKNKEE